MEHVTLNNGITMPQLGFGVYQIKDPTECNVFFQQHAAQAYLAKHRVAMESWAPFAEGKNNLFEKSVLKANKKHPSQKRDTSGTSLGTTTWHHLHS